MRCAATRRGTVSISVCTLLSSISPVLLPVDFGLYFFLSISPVLLPLRWSDFGFSLSPSPAGIWGSADAVVSSCYMVEAPCRGVFNGVASPVWWEEGMVAPDLVGADWGSGGARPGRFRWIRHLDLPHESGGGVRVRGGEAPVPALTSATKGTQRQLKQRRHWSCALRRGTARAKPVSTLPPSSPGSATVSLGQFADAREVYDELAGAEWRAIGCLVQSKGCWLFFFGIVIRCFPIF